MLNAGTNLEIGNKYYSNDKSCYLVFQGDGNLVLYKDKALWSSSTCNKGKRCIFQGDGNLVVYNEKEALWSSKSHGNPNAILCINDNATVTITSNGRQLWTTKSIFGGFMNALGDVALEVAKKEAERIEQERLAKIEQAKIEQDRIEQERLAKIEQEQLAKIEQERLAKIEAERIEQERLAKIEAERIERERLAKIAEIKMKIITIDNTITDYENQSHQILTKISQLNQQLLDCQKVKKNIDMKLDSQQNLLNKYKTQLQFIQNP